MNQLHKPESNYPLTYIPSLDVLRAIAVLLVIISHWFPHDHILNRYTPNGVMGVNIFFVISGYLISRILLEYRKNAEKANIKKTKLLFQFYIRRILRIFPIYYVTLTILFLLKIGDMEIIAPWHIFYLSNIYIYSHNQWTFASHLWSLSVEEQFYIFWPFIVLFSPKKILTFILAFVILFAPVFRIVLFILHPSQFIYVLTPSCMDAFGAGGLLAYFMTYSKNFDLNKFFLKSILFSIMAIVLLGFLFYFYRTDFYNHALTVMLSYSCYSVISFILVIWAILGFRGIPTIFGQSEILIFIGRISYSMYLFHNFIFDVLQSIHFPLPENSYLRISIVFLLLIMTSVLSWFLFEKQVLKLKSYFEYSE